ncbi:MAG TPA: tetratricopeptide repeat protein, partial [Pyrinomonadaceae bacterium]|nr:tetratricopeptide repeat protein [Pyrinomonadaceae bacterium]
LGNYYCLWKWDYVRAEQEFRRASELNQSDATAHHWLSAGVLVSLKRFDEAISEAKKAQEVDPLSPIITVNLGDMYYYARRTDEAIDIYRQAEKLDPSFCVPLLALGNALSAKGQYSEAVSSFRQALKLCNGEAYTKGLLAAALARAGQRDEAVNLVKEVEQQAKDDFVRSDALVFPYISLGNKEEALVRLEKMVDEHVVEAVLLDVDPLFDDLRVDPRFKALLKRINLPE